MARIYTVKEIAAHFNRPPGTIRRWKKEGRIRAARRPTPRERARLLRQGRLKRNRRDVWVVGQAGLEMIEVPKRGRRA